MPINIDGSKGIRQNTTEVTKIPVGTTAQRTANPEAGMIRFNTDEGYVEWYDDASDLWYPTSEFVGVVATGGTVAEITQDGIIYRVHTFTSSGTFEVIRDGKVECLIVAGGGGGGNSRGGGGGAGGLILRPDLLVQKGNYAITVGEGGLHVPDANPGTDGGNSSFEGLLVAVGGGGGGAVSGSDDPSIYNGRPGGSGGGGRRSQDVDTEGGLGTQPTQEGNSGDPFGFGNDGAGSTADTDNATGGGGAGGPGIEGEERDPIKIGGPGLNEVTINAETYNFNKMFGSVGDLVEGESFFASGGAGQGGLSRPGGGGEGNDAGNFPGKPNTGGGGGGSRTSGGTDGGSGIVIVRYRI